MLAAQALSLLPHAHGKARGCGAEDRDCLDDTVNFIESSLSEMKWKAFRCLV